MSHSLYGKTKTGMFLNVQIQKRTISNEKEISVESIN